MTLLQHLVVWLAPLVVPQLPVLIVGLHGHTQVPASDARLAPYLAAMSSASTRTQMGFSDLPKDGDITIETAHNQAYDVMLSSYGKVTKSIGFRSVPGGYEWIYEQELHQGPRKFVQDESETNEFVVLEYQTQPVNGIPLNVLYIRYYGPEYRLARRDDLTMEEIRPILEEWSKLK